MSPRPSRRAAFRADNTMAVLRRVCDDQPRPIQEVNPEIPDWLEAIVLKLLAKNPAGWHEALDMLEPMPQPVIVAINARIADGHDPSWLWDVPFERLRGRRVVATGERRLDLAVRLRYAEVEHLVETTLDGAVAACDASRVDVAANYTAFQEYLAALS